MWNLYDFDLSVCVDSLIEVEKLHIGLLELCVRAFLLILSLEVFNGDYSEKHGPQCFVHFSYSIFMTHIVSLPSVSSIFQIWTTSMWAPLFLVSMSLSISNLLHCIYKILYVLSVRTRHNFSFKKAVLLDWGIWFYV